MSELALASEIFILTVLCVRLQEKFLPASTISSHFETFTVP